MLVAVGLRHHEIAEAEHRILNPLLESDLRLIGEAAAIADGTRILDLCSGKGEMLCRWAEWFRATGIGVDLSPVFVAAARARANELQVHDRVRFLEAEAATYAREAVARERGAFDLVACIGATWIGGGLAGTIELMRPLVRPGGAILVGEPFYEEPPPPRAFADWGFDPEDYASLIGTLDRLDTLGLELEEMVAADARGWERYEAGQWRAIARWLAANPDDYEAAAMRHFLDEGRRSYLAWGRRYLGWAVFVTRLRDHAGPVSRP